jgi:hypothetical protein
MWVKALAGTSSITIQGMVSISLAGSKISAHVTSPILYFPLRERARRGEKRRNAYVDEIKTIPCRATFRALQFFNEIFQNKGCDRSVQIKISIAWRECKF